MKYNGPTMIWILIILNLANVCGNHFQWWKCSAQCQKCIRRATPLERWISEYYSGLFNHNPPLPQINYTLNPPVTSSGGCCQTHHGYFAPEHANVSGRLYKVVHVKAGNQFIPIGRCLNGTTCSHGICQEVKRYHWTLVYNNVKNATAPVTFVKFGVPSHCECMNIARSKP